MEICKNSSCTGCEACVQRCPVNCITMQESKDGFYYPKINDKICISCKLCIKTCPNNREFKTNKSKFYMGWHTNLEVLKDRSSGGAFTALSDIVFSQNGVVYGAYFDDKTKEVYHIPVTKKEDLHKIRKSKYYQGHINNIYKQVEEDLKNKLVLFSGTSCQIAGLYSYLGKNYENLITVDILCHGIASKKVVDYYIKNKEKQYKKEIKSFQFRVKPNDSDWMNGGGTRMKLYFKDGTSIIQDKIYDTYFFGFNSYLFLRKSCYECKYVGTNRISDITIADYWGVPENEISEKEKKYGVSLILVNSLKGNSLIKKMNKDMVIKEIESDNAIAYNQALTKPSSINIHRKDFFQKIEKVDFDKLVHSYNKAYYIKCITKNVIKKIVGEQNCKKISKTIKGKKNKK